MVPVIVPVNVMLSAVTVPVNVGLAKSALVAEAVAMLLYSTSCSVPLTTLAGLPEGYVSLMAKSVVLT